MLLVVVFVWVVVFFFQFLGAWLYPVHSQGECLNPPVLFSFGSAELHFRFKRNPKGRGHHAAPGTFWQVGQMVGTISRAPGDCRSPAGLDRTFPPPWDEMLAGSPCFLIMLILCFSAVLPMWRVLFFII